MVILLVPEVKRRAKRCQSEKEGEKIICKNKDKIIKQFINKEVRITLISAEQTLKNKIFIALLDSRRQELSQ